MTNLNVIDFDKTLIPYDSFRSFVLRQIIKFNLSILLLTLMRLMRFINAESYKCSIIKITQKTKSNSFNLEEFVNELIRNIDSEVLSKVEMNTDVKTINVLCSASPDIYISMIANRMSWTGYGSFFKEDNTFIHLYGENKKEFILMNYPKSNYHYNFSISDSKSDLPLLELFDNYELL